MTTQDLFVTTLDQLFFSIGALLFLIGAAALLLVWVPRKNLEKEEMKQQLQALIEDDELLLASLSLVLRDKTFTDEECEKLYTLKQRVSQLEELAR